MLKVYNFASITSQLKRLPIEVSTIIFCSLFSLAHIQSQLFTSNQNTYFLKGLATAGYGYLSGDWLAQQTDNIPVFSWLVSAVYSHFQFYAFYMIHAALAWIYAYSLITITRTAFQGMDRRFALAFWIFYFLFALFNVAEPNPIHHALFDGLAGQYVLGNILQPSAFGVFLIASIALFLRGNSLFGLLCSILCIVIATTFHPTYTPSSLQLMLCYTFVVLLKKHERKTKMLAIVIIIFGVILIVPTLVYIFRSFSPSSLSSLAKAQQILVNERIPHHARVDIWFKPTAILQIGFFSLWLIYSYKLHKVLFFILLALSSLGAILTIAQFTSGNLTLALSFPWRVSVIIFPIASSIALMSASYFVAVFINYIVRKISIRIINITYYINITFIALTALIFMYGIGKTYLNIRQDIHTDTEKFVNNTKERWHVYLIPVEDENFRLSTGAPIFVDYKSHPYRDDEIIDWHKRIEIARRVYTSKTNYEFQTAIADAAALGGVTHVVLPAEFPLSYFHYLHPVACFTNRCIFKITK